MQLISRRKEEYAIDVGGVFQLEAKLYDNGTEVIVYEGPSCLGYTDSWEDVQRAMIGQGVRCLKPFSQEITAFRRLKDGRQYTAVSRSQSNIVQYILEGKVYRSLGDMLAAQSFGARLARVFGRT